jgi:hypothetical protein
MSKKVLNQKILKNQTFVDVIYILDMIFSTITHVIRATSEAQYPYEEIYDLITQITK